MAWPAASNHCRGGVVQGPGGVANKQVKTNIDKETGKLTMLYEVWFHDK